MKREFYKIGSFLFLLLPIALWGHTSTLFFTEKVERKVHKEFIVDADAELQIRNSFGNVNVVSWEENKVIIDVTITVKGRNKAKIEDRLETISIEFQNNPNLVKATTIIENKSSWSWFTNYNTTDFQIDYEIKVPVQNNLTLSNDYGSILLDDTEGNTNISCDYGKLIIGELRGDQNILSFDYTSNSSIDYIKKGTISSDYSGFELGKAGSLNLSADYTNITILKIDTLQFSTDFGKLTVDHVGTVQGEGDYMTLRFGQVHQNFNLETDYGSIKIGQLSADVNKVNISGDYTGIRIGVSKDWDFQFEIDLDYAGFQSDLPLEYAKKIKDNTEKYYQGFHLNQNSTNSLKVEADYGNLKILQQQQQ